MRKKPIVDISNKKVRDSEKLAKDQAFLKSWRTYHADQFSTSTLPASSDRLSLDIPASRLASLLRPPSLSFVAHLASLEYSNSFRL